MNDFSTRKLFLTPSFELGVKETLIFDRFYKFLDSSGVGRVIQKYIKNGTALGGRPNVDFYNLFAVIIYGFAFGRDTLREIEDACAYDIRYISIMEQIRPTYVTIANFINNVIVPNETEIFSLLNKQIMKEMQIDTTNAYIDGTKFEANANRYKFVWKPLTFHKKLTVTFFRILKENKLCESFRDEEYISSKTVGLAIEELERTKDKYPDKTYLKILKALNGILLKALEYEEKEAICGEGRKSYFKTDIDATAMCLKEDYYSGLGSNMHAAYNTQILVIEGLVFNYYVSQSRADIDDFIDVLKGFKEKYGYFPANVCADAGYGSLSNYRYMKENGINSYVKYQTWEGNADGTYPECYRFNEDRTITCLNGLIGRQVELKNRHPRKSGAVFYMVEGCSDCAFKEYCMKFMYKERDLDFKIFEVVPELMALKQESEENLLSIKGIELRINRSIQVEGAFGIIKQNKRYTRTKRKGISKVSTEMMLYFLGLNINKLFKYYETNKKLRFWEAPSGLKAQEFKKPSAKKLSKKGKRINDKMLHKN